MGENNEVDVDSKPQEDWPESLPQQIRRLEQAWQTPLRLALHRRLPQTAPAVVLLAYATFSVMIRMAQGALQGQTTEHVFLLIIGILCSGQVACACWVAWAPVGLKWRLPLPLAAAALLAFLGPQPGSGGAVFFLVLYAAMFVLFASLFAATRWVGGWRLIDQRDHQPGVADNGQFNIRYLLVLTTIVAAVTALGRWLVGDWGELENAGPSAGDIIGMLLLMSGVFSLLQVPAGVALMFPLLRRPRWLMLFLILPVLIAACSYSAAMIVTSSQPVAVPIKELWKQTASMSTGASVALMLSAALLRFGGYRITSGKATNA